MGLDLHYSLDTFDEAITEVLRLIAPGNVLDIGAGKGKYGRIVRDLGLSPAPRLTALEPGKDCRALLEPIYDTVETAPASVLYDRPWPTFDTVILGDVIEHMKFADGLDLLHYLYQRAAYILIVTPEYMPQRVEGDFHASHNSIWRPEAFATFDLFAHARLAMMHCYILRGYLDFEKPELADVCAAINAKSIVGKVPHGDEELAGPIQFTIHNKATVDRNDAAGTVWFYRPF